MKQLDAEKMGATRYGRLEVLRYGRRGAYKTAVCRCDCGNEKEILVSNLKTGRTRSCGCLERENQEKYRDLRGQRFGLLVALRPSDARDSCGSIIWICRCDCGNEVKCPNRQLIRGYKRDCGCVRLEKFSIAGQRFGQLTVLTPLSDSLNSGTLWRCRCDCGTESEVYYGNLLSGHTRSCGCLKEIDGRTYLDGTIVESLKAKLSKRNTSGYKGVYRSRDKWAAYITFAKHRYHLGVFTHLEDAVRARQEAEQRLFAPVLKKAEELSVVAESIGDLMGKHRKENREV